MCYCHHNPLYTCKNTIFLLNISSFLSSDLDSPFLLACHFSTLEFHHVLFVCLILRMLQLFEFSHILFQDRRTGISDFRAICCTVLKKKKKNSIQTKNMYHVRVSWQCISGWKIPHFCTVKCPIEKRNLFTHIMPVWKTVES